MATLKYLTGKTLAQVRAMPQQEFDALYSNLEDRNAHTECSMLICARANRSAHVKALEALYDLHMAIGHMPTEAINLRNAITKGAI